MQYAAVWNMTPDAVAEMPLEKFVEMTMHHKAINLKRPWWTGERGEEVYMMEKTTGQRQSKPRYRPR